MAEENVDLLNAILEGNLQEATAIIDRDGIPSGLSGGCSLLRVAIEMNHDDIVKLLIARGCPVNASETDHDGPLHLAARNGNFEVVELLLNKGADVNGRNKAGETSLLIAVEQGHLQIVELLLKCGADIDAEDNEGRTPLYFTSFNRREDTTATHFLLLGLLDCGDRRDLFYYGEDESARPIKLEIAKLLTTKGANVNAQANTGLTALHVSILRRFDSLFEHLLTCNADINLASAGGFTALHVAAMSGKGEIASILLNKGADVNQKSVTGETPLYIVVELGHLHMVHLLLNSGADVNAADNKGRTPLHINSLSELTYSNELTDYPDSLTDEEEYVKLEIAKALLYQGANINEQTKTGFTALHNSIASCIYPLANLLLDHNADINLANENGYTALHFAARRGSKDISSALLGKGASVNAKLSFGTTALHMAVTYDHEEVAKVLLESGAEVNCVDSYGSSPFTNLTRPWEYEGYKFEAMGSLLLHWGADVNFKAEIGRTALYIAAVSGNVRLVKFLLENGAQVDCKDDKGETPLHWASNPKIIESLIKFGASVDCRSEDGLTPLHNMSSFNRSRAIATLLEHGADMNIKCNRGLTPLDWTHYSYGGFLRREADVQGRFGDLEISTSDEEDSDDPIERTDGEDSDDPIERTDGEDSDDPIERTDGEDSDDPIERTDEEDGDDPIERTDTRDVLLRHQAKMEAIGFHFEESQYSARYEGRLEEFRKSFQEEVLLLKSEFINDTSVSYYDILTKDLSCLANYMNNENVVQASESEEYRKKFPIYGSLIKRRFVQGAS